MIKIFGDNLLMDMLIPAYPLNFVAGGINLNILYLGI
jgi:hypothetical protein